QQMLTTSVTNYTHILYTPAPRKGSSFSSLLLFFYEVVIPVLTWAGQFRDWTGQVAVQSGRQAKK
ncbi:MAG: hypothetical protein ACOYLN_12550, partial [Blastocatellia bacterium]